MFDVQNIGRLRKTSDERSREMMGLEGDIGFLGIIFMFVNIKFYPEGPAWHTAMGIAVAGAGPLYYFAISLVISKIIRTFAVVNVSVRCSLDSIGSGYSTRAAVCWRLYR
jgi:hypothetical protein